MNVVNGLNLTFFYGSFFYNGYFINYFKSFSKRKKKNGKGIIEMKEYNEPI